MGMSLSTISSDRGWKKFVGEEWREEMGDRGSVDDVDDGDSEVEDKRLG